MFGSLRRRLVFNPTQIYIVRGFLHLISLSSYFAPLLETLTGCEGTGNALGCVCCYHGMFFGQFFIFTRRPGCHVRLDIVCVRLIYCLQHTLCFPHPNKKYRRLVLKKQFLP